jgi:NAD+ synthase
MGETSLSNMQLSREVFIIDCFLTCRRIETFIREIMERLRRTGIVVPISGGLDSSVVASLCVRAVGRQKVIGLMLPERQGNPEALRYARVLADHLDIKTKTIDISKVLRSAGTYRFALSLLPSRRIKASIVKKYLGTKGENFFLKGIRGTDDRLVNRGLASFYTKQRARLMATYKFAEENGLMVVGSAHKTEDMVGLYVKFGVDDAADVMPLKNLYRSHILQLAEHLGVPSVIIARAPNPDLVPGVDDKYRDVLGISWDALDRILYGLEHNMEVSEIAEKTGIEVSAVHMTAELVKLTHHMRNPSLAPRVL